MKKILTIIIILILTLCLQSEEIVKIGTENGSLEGTLLIPAKKTYIPVVLIIAGSGPTDRNGNNPYMKNNSLKMLAEALLKKGIASLRYDKRGIAKSRAAGIEESKLRFDHFVRDAEDCIRFLKKRKEFSNIVVAGHSEGSLIGMIASYNMKTWKFISIAGPGVSADKVLKEQLKNQPAHIKDSAIPIIDKLLRGKTTAQVPPVLNSLCRPSIQSYLISWFRYHPGIELQKLSIPILVINGTTDIQVGPDQAEKLASANKKAKLVIVEGMNHVLKNAPTDRMQNAMTYNTPDLPIKKELVYAIADFIKK